MTQTVLTFTPPPPPPHFPAPRPKELVGEPTVGYIAECVRYTDNLSAFMMIGSNHPETLAAAAVYQQRVLNAYIRKEHPDDVLYPDLSTRTDLVDLITSVVNRTVDDRLALFKSDMQKTVDEAVEGIRKEIDDVKKQVHKVEADLEKEVDTGDRRFSSLSTLCDSLQKLSGGSVAHLQNQFDSFKQPFSIRNESQYIESAVVSAVAAGLTSIKNTVDSSDLRLQKIERSIDAVGLASGGLNSRFNEIGACLNATSAAATEARDAMPNVQATLSSLQQSHRLVVNRLRTHHGPWYPVCNDQGVDPTQPPNNYPLLEDDSALEELSEAQLDAYLKFYRLDDVPTKRQLLRVHIQDLSRA